MAFTERVHAYIAGKFYIYLEKEFKDRGEAAFLHATQYYGLQRGRRMAQRAIRDGKPLTQENYNYYGEWKSSEECKAEGCANVIAPGEDGESVIVTKCPWFTQFQAMGLGKGGPLYCMDLDSSISRGFNPFLGYQVDQTMYNADCCIQRVKHDNITNGYFNGKYEPGVRSWEYHCGHIYWSFTEVVKAIFSQKGQEIADRILADFASDYGEEMKEALLKYKDTNFNVCD